MDPRPIYYCDDVPTAGDINEMKRQGGFVAIYELPRYPGDFRLIMLNKVARKYYPGSLYISNWAGIQTHELGLQFRTQEEAVNYTLGRLPNSIVYVYPNKAVLKRYSELQVVHRIRAKFKNLELALGTLGPNTVLDIDLKEVPRGSFVETKPGFRTLVVRAKDHELVQAINGSVDSRKLATWKHGKYGDIEICYYFYRDQKGLRRAWRHFILHGLRLEIP